MLAAARNGDEATARRFHGNGLNVRDLSSLSDHRSAMAWLAALTEGVACGKVSKSLESETRKQIGAYLVPCRGHVTDEVIGDIRDKIAEFVRSRH